MTIGVYHCDVSRPPSKRVLWTLIVTVAVVGGTIAASAIIDARERRGEENPSNPALPVEIARDPNLASSEDTDGDSLFDWEENLRGTNPKLTDTDGDGTSDGAEVAAARDPKVAGPDDSILALASTTDAALSDEYQKNRRIGTLTDKFAENFAASYVDLKSDGSFTAEDRQTLLGTLSGISSGGSIATTYSADLIPAIASEDTASLQKYADAVAEGHINKILPLAEEMKRGGGAQTFGEGFRDIAKTVAGIPTPSALLGQQAKLANSYETTGSVTLTLAQENDPLASLVSIPSLQKAEEARAEATFEIARYLAGRGISLQTGKYAGFWSGVISSQ